MITISHQGNGYNVKVSWPGTGQRGYNVHARTVDALHEVIDHYYMHNGHSLREPVETCPLCQKK